MAENKPPAAPSNEAMKARIISHMNKDHTYELSHYLRAFNGLSASAARSPQLTDLTLDSMTIKSASGSHVVRISPPMGALSDARVRMIEMAQGAQKKLGLSDIRISEFKPPAGPGVASFVGVALYFFCATTLGLVEPDTPAWSALDVVFPFGAWGYKWLVKAIFVPVLVIHITEAWWIARTRLAKHGIEEGSKLWLLWVADTFIEGAPAMWRFDALVEAERKRRQSAKH
ncbi:hypothetical protein DL766_004816 [Monosporascus sp. MC13-8B]|uniref:DUF2470 domain-containing protein n=1 Tax=Monosporascus cannonballus TaxID=155416 RepID=A0ABY0HGT1_9PEZI|nr:hypothetical protein DL762_001253 [Monosporascus cannonballus]RYO99686.1 hypothetical protein DL763_001294 [Monosporascus cannonballus]RYP30544.1 hypothetical protein DL766_004816 [Monosporascus sp. MC13-8B]